jgi:hypothetical protein|tara:strand:+ start:358 stop:504 length:147 start_codon:yes stop_codon:yes gene_type:complete
MIEQVALKGEALNLNDIMIFYVEKYVHFEIGGQTIEISFEEFLEYEFE